MNGIVKIVNGGIKDGDYASYTEWRKWYSDLTRLESGRFGGRTVKGLPGGLGPRSIWLFQQLS